MRPLSLSNAGSWKIGASLGQSSYQARRIGCRVCSDFLIKEQRRGFAVRTVGQSEADERAALVEDIRALMRRSAQPVAVITTVLSLSEGSRNRTAAYAHAATLSSFTTISMDPPLLAFSLRMPSRMADAISSRTNTYGEDNPHFVVNVLSSVQGATAQAFAQPGLAPFPLDKDRRQTIRQDHPFATIPTHASQYATYHKDADVAVPVLSQSVGAFACSLVSQIKLHKDDLNMTGHAASSDAPDTDESGDGSCLFIASIDGVEEMPKDDDDGQARQSDLPLAYWEKKFTTIVH